MYLLLAIIYFIKFNEKFAENKKKNNQFNNTNINKYYKAIIFRIVMCEY